ncbi:PAS domain-containing protein [Sporolactobacillus sp. THM7-4]|nr:PAS domain-containing protein [Sporolactobacillus sp. THM7-4]
MKNQKFKADRVIRWGFVIASLLFMLFVLNEVIQAATSREDQLKMIDRKEWVESIVVRDNTLDLRHAERGLSVYSKTAGIDLAIYDAKRHLLYSTDDQAEKTLFTGSLPLFRMKDHSAVYISPLKSNHTIAGYVLIKGRGTVIVGLGLLYFFIFLAGVGLLFYRDYIIRSYAVPIRFATNMAEKMLEGSHELIASDSVRQESVLRLNLAMNRLSEAFHEINRSYATQRDSMATLIENIGNGLIFIDGSGRINYVNKTYKETFKTTANHWEFADYEKVIPYEEVVAMIDEAFRTRQRLSRQLRLAVHIEIKHFDVSCAPIINKHKKIRGIVVVFHDITDIKKLENMRKDFVANVSHELKTPITSLIGFTETLLDGAKDDKELEEQFLNIILHESRRLQSLIKDLLELSKIEQDYFSIQWQTVSLSKLLDSVLLIFSEKASEKDIQIEKLPGDEGWALGDPYRIRQIMINLITNAIAYTPQHGKVTLSVREKNNLAQFIISDTGIGIEKDQIPRIFERFYRVDKARSRDLGGTGLGLAIVKHLVEVHEGMIDVESRLGKGTTFTISFKGTEAPIG